MGHSIHGLYTVDLLNPKFVWHSTILVADSYQSILIGGVQEQYIDRASFEQDPEKEILVGVYARHGAVRLSEEDHGWADQNGYPHPKMTSYRIDLRLEANVLKPTEKNHCCRQTVWIQIAGKGRCESSRPCCTIGNSPLNAL
jgi:hypothetical protein